MMKLIINNQTLLVTALMVRCHCCFQVHKCDYYLCLVISYLNVFRLQTVEQPKKQKSNKYVTYIHICEAKSSEFKTFLI